MNRFGWRTPALLLGLSLLTSCLDPAAPGALVPPTADEDPALPQQTLNVAGHARAVHLQTFGDPLEPVLFVLHGGPGADFRLLLPVAQLADRYFVVMWDQRGAGLSERVPSDELTLNSFDEEIQQLRALYAPGRKVTLLGHSYGGNLAVRYAARHPDDVQQLVLVEPGLLTAASRARAEKGPQNMFHPALQDSLWQNEVLSPQDHALADSKAVAAVQEFSRGFYCPGQEPDPFIMWRYGTVSSEVVLANERKAGDTFNWAEGIENFHRPILVLTGTCGSLRFEVQAAENLPALGSIDTATIEGAGHLTLFTHYLEQTLAALRDFLEAYP